MEETGMTGQTQDQFADRAEAYSIAHVAEATARTILPQSGGEKCGCRGKSSSANPVSYPPVYALGRILPRFPNLGAEKEFAQAAGRAETAGLTDQQTLYSVLS